MKILMIHLPHSIERYAFQQSQFKKLELEFECIPAVAVNEISDHFYQEQGFGWQRPLRKVELACFLSHKKAWEHIVNSTEPTLILEDDAILSSDLKKFLIELEQEKFKEIDLVNLEVRGRKKIISKHPLPQMNSSSQKLFELYQDRTGAAGYILYPSGAQKLLGKLSKSAPALADAFIWDDYNLCKLQVEPALVIQQDQMDFYQIDGQVSFESIIGRSEQYKIEYDSTSSKIRFKCRRLLNQIKMGMKHLKVLRISQRRYISLNKDRF